MKLNTDLNRQAPILRYVGGPLRMSVTLPYKGYDGSVEYSAEDRVLHGRILGIRDMVSFGAAV
jgi:hypothetical protein